MHGYEPEELVGRHLTVFHTEAQMSRVEQLLDQLRCQGIFSAEEVWHTHRDGRVFPTLMHATLICDEDGTTLFMSTTAIDITERQQAEEALRRSEETAQAILNAATDSSVLINPEGTILALNAAAARQLGGKPEEFVGRCSYDLICPEAAKTRKARMDEVLRTGRPVRFQDENEGTISDCHVVPVAGAGGRVERLVFVARDIAGQARAERALRSCEGRLRSPLGASPAIVYTCQPGSDVAVTSVSDNVKAQLGYEACQFTDDPGFWLAHLHPEDTPRVLAGLAHLPESGDHHHEYRFQASDGTWKWIYDTLRLLRDEGGNPQEIVGYWVDVTRRKEAEQLARSRAEELAHVSRLSAMGEMAASLAHELNQPLAAIANYAKGSLYRIQSGSLSAMELGEPIERIIQQAARAGAIIRRIRNFVGRVEARYSSVDINEVVQQAVELVAHEAERRNIKLETNSASSLPLVLADRVQIQQVVVNLLLNALDALKDAKIRSGAVLVRSASAADGGVEVTVCDNGPGVPAVIGPRIFGPFFTTREGNMGMGLAICRTIISDHGGRIWLSDEPGPGAVFRFTLPPVESGSA